MAVSYILRLIIRRRGSLDAPITKVRDLLSWTLGPNASPTFFALFCIVLSCYNVFADSTMQEFDQVSEMVLLALVLLLWSVQTKKVRYRPMVLQSLLLIGLCMRLAYFYDKEQSMNFSTEQLIRGWKETLQESKVSQFLPLFLYLAVEAFILHDLYYNHTTFSRLKRQKVGLFLRASLTMGLVSLIAYTWA